MNPSNSTSVTVAPPATPPDSSASVIHAASSASGSPHADPTIAPLVIRVPPWCAVDRAAVGRKSGPVAIVARTSSSAAAIGSVERARPLEDPRCGSSSTRRAQIRAAATSRASSGRVAPRPPRRGCVGAARTSRRRRRSSPASGRARWRWRAPSAVRWPGAARWACGRRWRGGRGGAGARGRGPPATCAPTRGRLPRRGRARRGCRRAAGSRWARWPARRRATSWAVARNAASSSPVAFPLSARAAWMWALSWRSGSPRRRHRAAAATRAARRRTSGSSTPADASSSPGCRPCRTSPAIATARQRSIGGAARRAAARSVGSTRSATGEPAHARQPDECEAGAAQHGDQHEDGRELVAGPLHLQLPVIASEVMGVGGRDDHEGEADRRDPDRADDPVGAPPEPAR